MLEGPAPGQLQRRQPGRLVGRQQRLQLRAPLHGQRLGQVRPRLVQHCAPRPAARMSGLLQDESKLGQIVGEHRQPSSHDRHGDVTGAPAAH